MLTQQPANDKVKAYLKNISTITLFAIPQADQIQSSSTKLIFKLLFDYLFPLTSIFILLFGILTPRYLTHSRIVVYAPLLKQIGFICIGAWLAIKLFSKPSRKLRKDW